jgi:hypothetical protein
MFVLYERISENGVTAFREDGSAVFIEPTDEMWPSASEMAGPYIAPPEPDPQEVAAKEARARRNRLLNASDWTQVADAPVDQAAWAAYRQALRDIPEQPGFPRDVEWPTKP